MIENMPYVVYDQAGGKEYVTIVSRCVQPITPEPRHLYQRRPGIIVLLVRIATGRKSNVCNRRHSMLLVELTKSKSMPYQQCLDIEGSQS